MHQFVSGSALILIVLSAFGLAVVALLVAMARKVRSDFQSGDLARTKNYAALSINGAFASAIGFAGATTAEYRLPGFCMGLFAAAFPIIIWTNQWRARRS